LASPEHFSHFEVLQGEQIVSPESKYPVEQGQKGRELSL
jgi:hypothetical protein